MPQEGKDLARRQEQEHLTAAKQRVEAIKEERLSKGEYDLSWFSPPGEQDKCEHVFLRLIVRGGLPLYFCDDCEWAQLVTMAYAIPKQHIPAYGLYMESWFLKYEGPKAMAQALIRPHTRLDKEGHPKLPPIEIVKEMKERYLEMLQYLSEYEQEALEEAENGHKEIESGDTDGHEDNLPDM